MSEQYSLNDESGDILDSHYYIPLRGNSLNKIIDAATPLLGMVLRIKEIDSESMPDNLYQQVVTDIQSIEQILREEGYDVSIIISCRYVLCTFIDEVVLSQGWGSNDSWINKSLLTYFHNETWGGEKVYILLEKLMSEPQKYIDLLEFMYICFSLGFRGRYKINNYNGEFENIYKKLYELLLSINGKSSGSLILYQDSGEKENAYHLKRKLTIKEILGIGALFLVIVYLIYFFKLEHQSDLILKELNTLLK